MYFCMSCIIFPPLKYDHKTSKTPNGCCHFAMSLLNVTQDAGIQYLGSTNVFMSKPLTVYMYLKFKPCHLVLYCCDFSNIL